MIGTVKSNLKVERYHSASSKKGPHPMVGGCGPQLAELHAMQSHRRQYALVARKERTALASRPVDC